MTRIWAAGLALSVFVILFCPFQAFGQHETKKAGGLKVTLAPGYGG